MTAPTTTTATPVAASPAAVLWDMDGTLVDTEPYWMACEHELVDAFGGRWTNDDARSIVGFDLLAAAAELRSRGGVDLPPRQIVERLQDGVIARIRHRVPWRPGARRLLAELGELGVPCALVTMSWEPLARAVVDALGPASFRAVVTGDMVTNGKPHPEPYLEAAARLGVDPVECVAIEDSPTGVASARAAGCVVVAVPNLVEIPVVPGVHVLPTLKGVTPGELGAIVAATPLPSPAPTGARGPLRARSGHGAGEAEGILVRVSERWNVEPRRLAVVAVALAVVVGAVIAFGVGRGDDDGPARQPGALTVHTWAPYWALDASLDELDARVDVIHELSPFWYAATGVDDITRDPNAPEDATEEFVSRARDLEIPLVASILDATDSGEMAAILADEGQRTRHVDAIVEFAADGDWAGIDLDYEQFAFADGRDTWSATRPNWVAFVTELAARLHADGRTIAVSIPPVYDAGQTGDSGYWVYDYAAITPVVDNVRIMAYDYSVAGSDPGPIAPLDWVARIIEGTAEASGDTSKLILGVPLYGRNWPVETSGTCPDDAPGVENVTNRSVDELVTRRGATPEYDPATGEWSFSYEAEFGDPPNSCIQQRQVFYVDDDGVQQRIQLAVDAGFGGVALFAFGYDNQEVWSGVDTVNAALAAQSTAPPPEG